MDPKHPLSWYYTGTEQVWDIFRQEGGGAAGSNDYGPCRGGVADGRWERGDSRYIGWYNKVYGPFGYLWVNEEDMETYTGQEAQDFYRSLVSDPNYSSSETGEFDRKGRQMVMFPGYNHLFHYDPRTGTFYVPWEDRTVNPIEELLGDIQINNSNIIYQNGGYHIWGSMIGEGTIGEGYRANYIYGDYDANYKSPHINIYLATILANWIVQRLKPEVPPIQRNGYLYMDWDAFKPGDTVIVPITPGRTQSWHDSTGAIRFYSDTIFWIRRQ